jgi:mono/diheme cytochrome c family protein
MSEVSRNRLRLRCRIIGHSKPMAPVWLLLLFTFAHSVTIGKSMADQTERETVAEVAHPAGLKANRVDFAKQIQPLLARKCYACHGPDQAEGGLRLTDRDSALAETDSGDFAILPGDPNASALISRVTSEVEGERMPPEGDRLSDAEVELLRQWIAQDAPWSKHWAFEPMKRVVPPTVDDPLWNANPVDAFIYHKLDAAGLRPNPPADRRTLIRRAYYDLTGLPPTAQEVEQFAADTSPDAFAKLVDRLLESKHYGEKWGRHWLDLVRYAETNSYERDGAKPNAWKYRDYVIKSFNDDKPYAQFVREQLAGDEVDHVTTETLTATGYYRLGIWDDEPADPLQAKFDELDDIISTTGQVFLGLTVDCARCHDHKIDPIPQADYYSMLAFLADVTPYGHRGDQHSNNQLDVSSAELNQRYADNDARRREIENAMREIEQEGIVKMSAPDQRATEGDKQARDRVLNEKLQQNLSPERWEAYGQLKQRLEDVASEFRALPPRERVLALANCEPNPQPTFVLFRGNPHSPTDEVGLAFPTLFGDAAPSVTPKDRSAGRRRVLADWIVNPDNRMSWRVIANRVWQFHFGRGIVESTNNFGQLGTPPTHPELLDYLAAEVVANEGRLKSIHRLMMNSQTYQMASTNRDDASSVDPGNDLFWKFDIRRLSAEEVRDSILAVNGSLNREVYGPSIYPRLSAEVLAGQSVPGSGWGKSSAQQENRRSVYIHVKRSLLTPLLSAFDLPEPDRSCEARFTTLQPGQALALLNGDFIQEQAARLADSVGAGGLVDDDEIVRRVIQAVLGRGSTDEEVAQATGLITELQADHGLTRRKAIDLFCLTVMNWNEFVFLD